MQKFTKKQLFLYSLLISGCIYLLIRVIWSLNGWLRGDNLYASMGLYILFVVLATLVGYVALHRKVAAIAAGSTAMVSLGLYNLIASMAHSLWINAGLVVMGLLISAGLFYGEYSFLSVTKRRKLTAVVVTVMSFAIGMSLSLVANLVLRISFAS